MGATDEPTPPPSFRSLRDLYQAITGDVNWYGVFNPEYVAVGRGLHEHAGGDGGQRLNKVVRQHYDNLADLSLV